MTLPPGLTLIATVCNTLPNAVPFTLWIAQGDQQGLIDLSGIVTSDKGDAGLTGLAWHGGRLYVAVQSASPRVLVFDRQFNLVGEVTGDDLSDLHSIQISNDMLVIVSTGKRMILGHHLPTGICARLLTLSQPVHISSADYGSDDFLLCCHESEWLAGRARGGAIYQVRSDRVVLDGLGHPHSLTRYGDEYLVLDSSGSRVIVFDGTGIRRQRVLDGFLRGCTRAGGSLFVANSIRRAVSRATGAVTNDMPFAQMLAENVLIRELDATTLLDKGAITPIVPGLEIYDLLAVDGGGIAAVLPERLLQPDASAIARLFFTYAQHLRAVMNG